jgi:hypothetical protein
MLAATLLSPGESERQMLFEQVHRLSSRDLFLLDPGAIPVADSPRY